MARWADLPLDAIYEILSSDTLWTEDLIRLSLVNKTFQRCARSALYRNIRVVSGRRSNTHPTRIELFTRSITENPDLTLLPRSAYFMCSLKDEEQFANFRRLIARLPLLEKLKISAFVHIPNFDGPNLAFLDENTFPRLRSLDVCHLQAGMLGPRNTNKLTWNEVKQYMSPPLLESLALGMFRGTSANPETLKLQAGDEGRLASKLKSLTVNEASSRSSNLDLILSHCHVVEDLTLKVTWYKEPLRNLSRVLSSRLHTTLTSLRLSHDAASCFKNTPIDLRGLEKVRKLEVEANFLCSAEARRNPSMMTGVYSGLPPALVEFKINFWGDEGPFPDHEQRSLKWLIELAEQKPTVLPRLSNLYVRETNKPSHGCVLRSVLPSSPHTPPDTISKLFAEKEIELHLRLLERSWGRKKN
ncbi:hypothetical protein FQN49_003279 [Arthroderma sp. PD_2]|nr:hypothetical protein FQN49_003279 [Arthroderma sp. PD_2]